MNKWISKRDIILILSLLVIALASFLVWFFAFNDKGDKVSIEVKGRVINEYPLDKDTVIPIENSHGEVTNYIKIENKECYMEEAICPDHLCTKQGKIKNSGQTIVCLPNKVVVSVISDDKAEYDTVAK